MKLMKESQMYAACVNYADPDNRSEDDTEHKCVAEK